MLEHPASRPRPARWRALVLAAGLLWTLVEIVLRLGGTSAGAVFYPAAMLLFFGYFAWREWVRLGEARAARRQHA